MVGLAMARNICSGTLVGPGICRNCQPGCGMLLDRVRVGAVVGARLRGGRCCSTAFAFARTLQVASEPAGVAQQPGIVVARGDQLYAQGQFVGALEQRQADRWRA